MIYHRQIAKISETLENKEVEGEKRIELLKLRWQRQKEIAGKINATRFLYDQDYEDILKEELYYYSTRKNETLLEDAISNIKKYYIPMQLQAKEISPKILPEDKRYIMLLKMKKQALENEANKYFDTDKEKYYSLTIDAITLKYDIQSRQDMIKTFYSDVQAERLMQSNIARLRQIAIIHKQYYDYLIDKINGMPDCLEKSELLIKALDQELAIDSHAEFIVQYADRRYILP